MSELGESGWSGVFSKVREIEECLLRVAGDRKRGARDLAVLVLDVFKMAKPVQGLGVPRYREAVLSLGRRAFRLRPSMASIGGVVSRLIYEFSQESKNIEESLEAFNLLRDRALKMQGHLLGLGEAIAKNCSALSASLTRPIVLSYSSTVIDVLRTLGKRGLDVTVCESRPGFEGRRTARLLVGIARSVAIITEAQIGLFVRSCDAAVLGCDIIFPDGSVANKVGSYVLALCAKEEAKQVVVLGDTFKIADVGESYYEEHRPGEVWKAAPEGIQIRNEYFEKVPSRLIDHIVTETGVWRPGDIRKLWRSQGRYRSFLLSPL